MNPDKLRSAGLGRIAEIVEANARDAVLFRTLPMEEEDFLVGQSKIGGLPHMPAGMVWPCFKDAPLRFLAQINLKELPDCAAARLLPRSGMLYFFHEGSDDIRGIDPGDAGGFRVLYADAAVLSPREPENGDEFCVTDGACAVGFDAVTEYPATMDTLASMGLLEGVSAEEREKFSEIPEEDGSDPDEDDDVGDEYADDDFEDEPRHKLLGWPDVIQAGDIFAKCRPAGDKTDLREWTLLFQLDSDDDADMMWGDAERLYFCIRKDDLKACNFEKVWAVSGCS